VRPLYRARNFWQPEAISSFDTEQTKKPTNVVIAKFNTANDPQLVSLYFQFGRYLLISGSQPTNLQGK